MNYQFQRIVANVALVLPSNAACVVSPMPAVTCSHSSAPAAAVNTHLFVSWFGVNNNGLPYELRAVVSGAASSMTCMLASFLMDSNSLLSDARCSVSVAHAAIAHIAVGVPRHWQLVRMWPKQPACCGASTCS
ncbi:hypothetical protein COO60DRAFT_1525000 [Scenedesmus sp. NREL 46B-D3]|nr:hypothetical protein COO60DRAFT_1525000 [Scenedesmus sp. NREL 46B-D3]